MSIFGKESLYVFLRVVQSCNLNCKHCFTLGNQDPFKILPLKDVDRFLRLIKENVDPVSPYIYIHGGEPFLAGLEYLEETAKIVNRYFPDKSLIAQTNLVHGNVNERFIRFVKEQCDGRIGVSWDRGIRFDKPAQEKLFFKNLEILDREDIKYSVNVTVQKHLLEMDPVAFVEQFPNAEVIDFEMLTVFDKRTEELRFSNKEWGKFYLEVLKYYLHNKTKWMTPMSYAFQENIEKNQIFTCKCNCCADESLTLNTNGNVGLCPDNTYYAPLTNLNEIEKDWSILESLGREEVIRRRGFEPHEMCYSCDLYEYCGGNVEKEAFDNSGECSIGREALRYQLKNKEEFGKRAKEFGNG